MRLWLNRSGDVSLREQLRTQIVLGILCRELLPGARLPSTRELARRFGIHANTASAAYRELEREGWLEFRAGSGVYVQASRPAAPVTPELATEFALDQLIGELVVKARKRGATDSLLRDRLRRWLAMAPPARWLVIEPDPELRRIVMHEMEEVLGLPVAGCGLQECVEILERSLPVVLPSKAAAVRKLLPAGAELTVLQVHPVAPELHSYLPAPAGVLVGIASRWGEFQRIAQTMLIAAGFAPESLLVRDAAKPGWKCGLNATAAVVCDGLTAEELPRGVRPIAFHLLAEATLEQMRQMEAALGGEPSTKSTL
jgi:GntR family transcriptional regulator